MKIKTFLLLILCLTFFVVNIYSTGAGVTSVNFLKISQGGRQSGMGEAFTGIADDVNAIYWNAAGLSQLTRNQACLMHSFWLLGVNFEYIAYALPVKGVGTFAAYGTFLNAGEIIKTTEDSAGQYLLTNEIAKASNWNFSLAYAKRIGEIIDENSFFSDLSAGLKINIINEEIYTDTGGGFGFDIGTFYYPKYENYSLGFVVQNAGFTNNRPALPLTLRLGFAYRFALEDIMLPFSEEGYFTFLDNNTVGDIDVIYYPTEQIARVNVGAEKYWILSKYHSVAARLGYKFGTDLGWVSGITVGLGYELTVNKDTNFDLDYAMTPYGDLGISHRISLTGKFLGVAESHNYEDVQASIEYYKKGYELLYQRKYQEALIQFSESLKRNKKYSPSYVGIGACFLNMGKKQLAYKAYSKGLEYDPSNTKLKEFLDSQDWTEIKEMQNKGK